jgi:glycosyltransferase involved in cell wall biosynthesis
MRVLVLHPSLKSPGGSSCLTAWALQALRGDFEVTLLSWTGVEVGHLKATYGTDLRTGDFTLVLPPAWLCRTFALSPIRLGLLRSGLLQKHARALDARERFDLIVSTDDVIDVHRHAVQYVHYPWIFYPRPGDSYEWYHLAPVMRLYRAGIDRFCELSTARMAANTTLTNSAWTALRIAEWYGTKAQVIHPPVAVERAGLPWEKRIDTFTTIGRIAPVKQIVETIDIIETVRARGHEVSLLICGQRDDGRYERRLREMAAARPWIELLVDAPRNTMLDRVGACRYGLHAMPHEHFGIAVAEMVRLGLVCFAQADGGTAEILGGDHRLLFESPEQAVEKICAVVEEQENLAAIRTKLAKQSEAFSAQRFVDEFRGACINATVADAASLPQAERADRNKATAA